MVFTASPSIATERLVGSSASSSRCRLRKYQAVPSSPARKRFQLLGSFAASSTQSRALWALSAAVTL